MSWLAYFTVASAPPTVVTLRHWRAGRVLTRAQSVLPDCRAKTNNAASPALRNGILGCGLVPAVGRE
ncbi:hypothetical protein DFJ69_0940 [Thermomonospora umbrina]|uniref:Uncharacterized protein n=1 Tax=Thermomonospora umbrina TaxID=111806 RepID=A0A3D9SMB8_9ACTN|nr:hypothetical protein DFJ69_0940 [Thermomonospora umbrina]